MNSFTVIALAIFLPFLSAATVPLAQKILRHRVGWFASAMAFVSFLLIAYVAPVVIHGDTFTGAVSWLPSVGVEFSVYIDGLSLLIGLIASGIGIIIMSYSNGYMSHKEDLSRYYQYLLLFMGSMIGMVFSANTIQLFIFWELTSITSFLLIGFWRHRPLSIYGATKSLIITAAGGLIMFIGFLILHSITGTFDIPTILHDSSMIENIKNHDLFLVTLIFIFIGAAAKSAQGPFYIWLPNAMEAPTPVSAFLHSATMVKAGVFLIARIHPIFSGTEAWFLLVSGTGMATMVLAGFLAFRQNDIKGILAFSTISQLAYLVTMYGYTTYHEPGIGVAAATFHLLNHATFKACLFLVAGIVAHEAATRDIRKLGGLRHEMPLTFIVASIGALAMAGIPPLNGFLSKEMFYKSSVEMGAALGFPFSIIVPAIAVVGGVLTFAYSIKLIDGIFLGKRKDEFLPHHIHEAPYVMLIPAGLLSVLVILFGLVPSIPVHNIIEPATSGILLETAHLHVTHWHGFTPAFMMTIITFVLGLLIYTKYESLASWQDRLNASYPWISVNYYYDAIVNNARTNAYKVSSFVQPGFVKTYINALLILTIALIMIPLIVLSGDLIPQTLNFDVNPYEALLMLLMVVAAIAATVLPKYIPAIIALSSLGYMVSLLFIYLKAPDLALTQILVETLTTIIFLLVIVRIPQTFREKLSKANLTRDVFISGLVSVGVFIVLINATQGIVPPFESLSHYFIEKSVSLTGGHNLVNVILVDFRGYDTLGEISVLCLAALGVYNLIHSRGER
ncbi:NADH/Ubiquinone/plastoquinone (complex I) [Methanohalobium evestigatum Z-7303]|uniref:NADH/Ubiquinone/plastoquinone (Complex I) n=1 Tax=Methanohalobium evestigatum (strain ATCC BAA-1072 / DSM 3721 / NBRC 107634 / OCM 161 / Z-7303) TaxID=644295 RepID=D7E771_METEZ|nr:hydrogen gas-evolving membrane-bound hydrogenase subunit E [Methanohalobium evestigatum]ADI73820.1 NADH/Ubiquinone/plastoquinone (complex I) [Methanohalobium evestigatum Z-7303]